MKKHSLFKVISMILVLLVIISWIAVGRNDVKSYIGFGDLFLNGIRSVYFFFDIFLFILIVGGFYGVLNKSSGYKKLLDNIVSKVKKLGNKFIYLVIILFALVSALTGMDMLIFMFIPFVISIILLLGYDKLVAISATVVSSIIGVIGGIFVTFRDPNNYYGTTNTTMEKFVGIEENFANVFPKLLLLVLGVALLIFYVSRHIKSVKDKKVKYELNTESDSLLVNEVKGDYKKVKAWPLIVVLAFLFVYTVIGVMPWKTLFNVEVFTKFHTWLVGLGTKNFSIFNNLISGSFTALGEWNSNGLGNYMMPMIIMLILSLVVKFISHIKFDEYVDAFISGMKKLLPSAFVVVLAYSVLVGAYNHGFLSTLISKTDYNIGLAGLYSLVGSILHVDLYYTSVGVFSSIISLVEDEALYPVLAVLFQGFYGLINIVGPTSLLLIVVLTYLDVPYTTWLKYIWRLFLYLFIVICLVLAIMLI